MRKAIFSLTNQNMIIKQQMMVMLETRKSMDQKIKEHEKEKKINEVY